MCRNPLSIASKPYKKSKKVKQNGLSNKLQRSSKYISVKLNLYTIYTYSIMIRRHILNYMLVPVGLISYNYTLNENTIFVYSRMR